jgi:hypothetical protein
MKVGTEQKGEEEIEGQEYGLQDFRAFTPQERHMKVVKISKTNQNRKSANVNPYCMLCCR